MSKSGKSRTQDALCFCEYDDMTGNRSHIMACCCDCEAVDNFCDKCLTCQSIPDETVERMFETIEDRCRLPWLSGAKRIPLDVAFPIILIPCGLLVATKGYLSTMFVFVSFPVLLLAFYRNWSRRRRKTRTRLFYVWGLASVVQLYYVYITIVVGFREILLWETMLLTTLFFATLFAFYRAKNDPGVIASSKSLDDEGLRPSIEGKALDDDEKSEVLERRRHRKSQAIHEYEVTWVDSRAIKEGRLETWCNFCLVDRPPRSGHCPLCNVCIRLRDHHCVWIDACIGRSNHSAFLAALVLCIVTGLYGAHLTMTTICTPEMYLDWFLWPADCRFVYSDFPTSLSFVSACYAYIAVTGLSVILLQQVLLISQNLTLQELTHARRRGLTRFLFYARNNVNNRGIWRNWSDFFGATRREKYLQTSAAV